MRTSLLVTAAVLVSVSTGGAAFGQPISPEQFLADYRPKAAALTEHLYKNVSQQTEYLAVSDSDFNNLKLSGTSDYIANSDRMRCTLTRKNGARSVMILRPDVFYNPYSSSAVAPFALAEATVLPVQVRDKVADMNWWMLPELEDDRGFGIGVTALGLNVYQAMASGKYRIDTVQTINDTEVCVGGVSTVSKTPLNLKFYFRKPGYVLYLVESSWPLGGKTGFANYEYEYRMWGDNLSTYEPLSYHRKALLQEPGQSRRWVTTKRASVKSFKKESHPESAFRLAQYGLPEIDTGSKPTSWTSRALVIVGVAIAVVLVGNSLRRARKSRRAAAAS